MSGKIVKIVSNDLYGNVDERKVVVFSCFEHTKYMNNYVIFTFDGEYEKKKLYYGSVHLKKDSIVIFSVKQTIKKYIDEFVSEFTSGDLKEYKILDINKIEKVELVSYNEIDYDDLALLDSLSIEKKDTNLESDIQEKKPLFLYALVFFLILILIGLTLLYFYPDKFSIKYKELLCNNILYDQNLALNYRIEKNIKFNRDDKVDSIKVVKTYNFLDSEVYFDFKNNNRHEEYFKSGETYKFIDDSLIFKLMYDEIDIIDDYDEMLTYMKKEGFSCIEKEYEK